MALAPALGEPCAFLVRPQSRLRFLVRKISCPVLWCSFSCKFLLCIGIHLLSIDFPLNPKGNRRICKMFNSYACPCIFLSENISSLCFTYALYFHFHACVFDKAAWTTGQLWTWSLRVSCAKLALNWAEKLSLAGLLLITFLITYAEAWEQDLHETANGTNTN